MHTTEGPDPTTTAACDCNTRRCPICRGDSPSRVTYPTTTAAPDKRRSAVITPPVAPTVNALCDAMWEGRFDMPESLNPRPWAWEVVPGVLAALDAAGYEVVRRAG